MYSTCVHTTQTMHTIQSGKELVYWHKLRHSSWLLAMKYWHERWPSQLTLSANFNMQVHLHVKKSNRMFSSQLACQRFTCGMFWFITNNHYISLLYRQLAKWKTCIFIYPSQYISNMQGLVQGKIFLGQMFCFSVQHAVQSVHM